MKYEVTVRATVHVEASCEDEAEEAASEMVREGLVLPHYEAVSLED